MLHKYSSSHKHLPGLSLQNAVIHMIGMTFGSGSSSHCFPSRQSSEGKAMTFLFNRSKQVLLAKRFYCEIVAPKTFGEAIGMKSHQHVCLNKT